MPPIVPDCNHHQHSAMLTDPTQIDQHIGS